MGASYSFYNWLDLAGITLAGGAWSSDLPRTNVADSRIAVVARTSGVLTTDTVLTIDLGAAYRVDMAAIIAHNLTADATVRWRGNSSADMTTPLYDSGVVDAFPVQWDTGVLPDGHPNAATRRLTTAQIRTLRWDVPTIITPTTARYWQLNIADTANADSYVQIGRLWLGSRYEPSYNYRYGASDGLTSESVIGRSLSGTRYVDARPIARTVTREYGDLPPDEARGVMGDLLRVLSLDGQCYYVDDDSDAINLLRTSFLAQQQQLSSVVKASFRQSSVVVSLEEVR